MHVLTFSVQLVVPLVVDLAVEAVEAVVVEAVEVAVVPQTDDKARVNRITPCVLYCLI